MIKVILAILVMVIGIFACAQSPPKQVSDAINKKFKSTSNVKWEQEENDEEHEKME